jgi:D-lactate dehydrogenase
MILKIMSAGRTDYRSASERYREFYDEASVLIPASRLFRDHFRTFAYGTDASFYRLTPSIVAKVRTPEEVSGLLKIAGRLKTPVTFRAAGTSLSGQAVTDSVLVVLAGGWNNHCIHDNGERITLGPGVTGAEANLHLGPYGRKIGPDPASINSCMIGGIAANNSSGMCCGTAQNSYRTVESMKIIFHDGFVLDTGDPESRRLFAGARRDLMKEMENIRDEINGDRSLRQRIIDKYAIKNTTGYSINAFVDYSDPLDIILHLMIGSEGTLGFISEITYRTVPEHKHKASSLVIFPDIGTACEAAFILRNRPVSAVELMDGASLRSVQDRTGMPAYLKSLNGEAAALLIETRAEDRASLLRQTKEIEGSFASIPAVFPFSFTDRKDEYENTWDVRRGLLPAVGAARRTGTTVIIEDVAVPVENLAEAAVHLKLLMKEHGYSEGIIFGHALDGNLHFVFTQDFSLPEEVKRYRRLMDEVACMVVEKYDGSLKGEHGTGRNMAPFVELEWGERVYNLMKRIKKAFDPGNILNPGVIINNNRAAHLQNLKRLPATHEIIDKCMECGYCEVICPSKDLTTTPRQRIVIQREISRLRASGEDPERLKSLESDYDYLGEQTCAADGLCSTACPVSINTGDLTRRLRSLKLTGRELRRAQWAASHYPAVISGVGLALDAAAAVHSIIGTSLMSKIAGGMRALSGNAMPSWNACMPRGSYTPAFADIINGSDHKVVYFPSCVVRTMGPSKRDRDRRQVFEAMLSVLGKADYDVLFPKEMERLCCGMPFESKGCFAQADKMSRELEEALLASSNGGEFPVLCDTSPCLYRMRRSFKSDLRLYEPVEFVHTFLMDRLAFKKSPETVALHVTCSSVKMGLTEKFREVALACAREVFMQPKAGCCGFAGDKGFAYPELNASALCGLRPSLPADCGSGYSNSRTCEIGLSLHGGIPYQSIVYLVDRCTESKSGHWITQKCNY